METVPAQTEHTGTGGAGFRIAQRSGHFERFDGGAIGQKAGKCFYIYDSNNDVVPYYGNVFMARSMKAAVANDAAEAAGEAAGLDFKTIKLKYSIQAKFVLE